MTFPNCPVKTILLWIINLLGRRWILILDFLSDLPDHWAASVGQFILILSFINLRTLVSLFILVDFRLQCWLKIRFTVIMILKAKLLSTTLLNILHVKRLAQAYANPILIDHTQHFLLHFFCLIRFLWPNGVIKLLFLASTTTCFLLFSLTDGPEFV